MPENTVISTDLGAIMEIVTQEAEKPQRVTLL